MIAVGTSRASSSGAVFPALRAGIPILLSRRFRPLSPIGWPARRPGSSQSCSFGNECARPATVGHRRGRRPGRRRSGRGVRRARRLAAESDLIVVWLSWTVTSSRRSTDRRRSSWHVLVVREPSGQLPVQVARHECRWARPPGGGRAQRTGEAVAGGPAQEHGHVGGAACVLGGPLVGHRLRDVLPVDAMGAPPRQEARRDPQGVGRCVADADRIRAAGGPAADPPEDVEVRVPAQSLGVVGVRAVQQRSQGAL